MRRRFIASDAAELRLNDHVAWCGDGPSSLDRVAVSAFSVAAARGEQLLFVSDRPDPRRLSGLEDRDVLMRRGVLRLATVEDSYRAISDSAAQRAFFECELDRALAGGFTGMCVVADNSSLVNGSTEEFAAWLAWEAVADQLEADRSVTGVCYFDRRAVPDARLADLAAMHPVLSTTFDAPAFQVFADGDVVGIAGELDALGAERLHRTLSSLPAVAHRVLDLSTVDFVDHRALITLTRVAREGEGLVLRGTKPIVRRIWQLLELDTPALEFS